MKIGKIVLNVRLAGDHLYWKLLFTWLSLMMSMMVSVCAVLFIPRPKGSGDIAMNLASVRRLSIRPYVRP